MAYARRPLGRPDKLARGEQKTPKGVAFACPPPPGLPGRNLKP